MQTYVTRRCSGFGHPEITLQLREQRSVPVERMLLGYFEQAVARGSKFLPGQTVQVGSATLRLCTRRDGTLGIEEETAAGWVESCDRSLMRVWLQKEVVASVGLEDELSFPQQHQTAMVAECALGSATLVLMRLQGEPGMEAFSGWSVACPQDHEHGERGFPTLLQLSDALPSLDQFLALPVGTAVLVMGPGRIRASVLRNGSELTPRPGSYLAALNEGRV